MFFRENYFVRTVHSNVVLGFFNFTYFLSISKNHAIVILNRLVLAMHIWSSKTKKRGEGWGMLRAGQSTHPWQDRLAAGVCLTDGWNGSIFCIDTKPSEFVGYSAIRPELTSTLWTYSAAILWLPAIQLGRLLNDRRLNGNGR